MASTRDKKIKFLVANCACWKGKEKLLANKDVTDEMLDDFVKDAKGHKETALTVNAFKQLAVAAGVEEDLSVNEMPAALAKAMGKKNRKADPDEEEEEDDDEEKPKANANACSECGGKMVAGKCSKCGYKANRKEQTVTNRQLTEEEWLAQAPASIRERDKLAKKLLANEKRKNVQLLVANIADDDRRQAVAKRLMGKDLEELEELVELIPTRNQTRDEDDSDEDAQPFYLGAGGSRADNARDDDDEDEDVKDMIPPTTNWAELEKRGRNGVAVN